LIAFVKLDTKKSIETIKMTQSIIVKAGDPPKLIPARTYDLDTLIIERGARVIVTENSQQWLLLICRGDAQIDGELIFEKFIRTANPITATTPDGQQLTHTFSSTAKCGNGGNGGIFNTHPGGHGAMAGADYGGGGGSGGYYQGGGHAGTDATDINGAGVSIMAGGKGGRLSLYCNGGLVYLSVSGRLSGSGVIRLRGLDGVNGTDGGPGEPGGGSAASGGGGGGGSAGGEGGRLKIRASNRDDFIDAQLSGGKKGLGGQGGHHAQNGSDGEDGASGYQD
jgi:hypothetical protein